MTTKQKKVLDFMIKWAEKEIENNIYDSTKQLEVEALAKEKEFSSKYPASKNQVAMWHTRAI